MKFNTYQESRIDAIKTAAAMFNESFDASAVRVDGVVSEIRKQCEISGVPNKTQYIRGADYKFKIDATYLTFD